MKYVVVKKDVSIKHVVNEKAVDCSKDGTYLFDIVGTIDKPQIAALIEEIFPSVKVESVNTLVRKSLAMKFRGKPGKTQSYKRAFVKLKSGSIDIRV